MGNRRLNTPLVTINAMVRVGPWVVEKVTHGEWRKCDRCTADHKEVWVCTVDATAEDVIAKLPGGKRTWLVGSTCGPTLEMVSDASWPEQAKDLRRIVRLAVDATRTLERARDCGLKNHMYLPWIAERLELLKRGELSRHLQKVLRHHVTQVRESVDERLRRQERPSSPP